MPQSVCFLPIWIASVLCVCGGGPSEILVAGKVTKGGSPLPLGKGESLSVSFAPLDRPGDSFSAATSRDGSFVVPGLRRRGVAPGKYRISVALMPDRGKDRLGGKFSGTSSPFIRDITSDKEEILIDLDKP